MKIWVSESERVKRQAGEEMVVLLQGWKKESDAIVFTDVYCVLLWD